MNRPFTQPADKTHQAKTVQHYVGFSMLHIEDAGNLFSGFIPDNTKINGYTIFLSAEQPGSGEILLEFQYMNVHQVGYAEDEGFMVFVNRHAPARCVRVQARRLFRWWGLGVGSNYRWGGNPFYREAGEAFLIPEFAFILSPLPQVRLLYKWNDYPLDGVKSIGVELDFPKPAFRFALHLDYAIGHGGSWALNNALELNNFIGTSISARTRIFSDFYLKGHWLTFSADKSSYLQISLEVDPHLLSSLF